jgi:archaellum component FlaC
MYDNLNTITNRLRSSVTTVKKKVNRLKTGIDELNLELEALDTKLEKVFSESEIYKARLEREMGREVRRLERELENLRKQVVTVQPVQSQTSEEALSIASTISVLECVLKQICNGSEDFRLASYSFLFPAVIERVVKGQDEAYFLEELPSCVSLIINRGRSYVEWLRSECNTHLTDSEAWEVFAPKVTDWWRNDALPLLYGCRDEQWDIDMPYTLVEMMNWRDNPADRPVDFSPVFDAYEIYRTHKNEVYESSGVKNFNLKTFSYGDDDEN